MSWAISADEYPTSARTASLSWPTVGDAVRAAVGVPDMETTGPTMVRAPTSSWQRSAARLLARTCGSSTSSSTVRYRPAGTPACSKDVIHSSVVLWAMAAPRSTMNWAVMASASGLLRGTSLRVCSGWMTPTASSKRRRMLGVTAANATMPSAVR